MGRNGCKIQVRYFAYLFLSLLLLSQTTLFCITDQKGTEKKNSPTAGISPRVTFGRHSSRAFTMASSSSQQPDQDPDFEAWLEYQITHRQHTSTNNNNSATSVRPRPWNFWLSEHNFRMVHNWLVRLPDRWETSDMWPQLPGTAPGTTTTTASDVLTSESQPGEPVGNRPGDFPLHPYVPPHKRSVWLGNQGSKQWRQQIQNETTKRRSP